MKNYNKKKNFLVDNSLLDKIVNSLLLTEQEKLNFLKYISYLTSKEKRELYKLV
ncbi:MAG: hypothetical protein PHN31_04730 [Candidatus Gracilibacteria bacterium]|nr:hypothetical protein [Candidatus Gracilibacteria bacterium]